MVLVHAYPGLTSYYRNMGFPIKVCSICAEEFELRPGKPGFANRCPACTSDLEAEQTDQKRTMDADERRSLAEANDARRSAIRDLLYSRK